MSRLKEAGEETMRPLAVVQIGTIKAFIDILADLDISPLHLHINTKHQVEDTLPNVTMWTQTRTDFERLCSHLKTKPVKARYSPDGQRHWHTTHDTADLRALIHCVSFKHHTDWQPKPSNA